MMLINTHERSINLNRDYFLPDHMSAEEAVAQSTSTINLQKCILPIPISCTFVENRDAQEFKKYSMPNLARQL